MKPDLQAKDRRIKDNHPPWYFYFNPQSGDDKDNKEEKEIYDDGPVAQDHQYSFQPGKRDQLPVRFRMLLIHLDVPDHHCRQEAEVHENGEFGEEAHVR